MERIAMQIRSFRDLKVWGQGKELAKYIYRLTSSFPGEERYGITSQMRRASVSVPANIAEGFNRHHSREFRRFPNIALGSCAEPDTLLEPAFEFGYVNEVERDKIADMLDQEGKMLRGLARSLGNTDQPHIG